MCVIADALLLTWTGRGPDPTLADADCRGLSTRARKAVKRVVAAMPDATAADLARVLTAPTLAERRLTRNCGDVTRRQLLDWCAGVAP